MKSKPWVPPPALTSASNGKAGRRSCKLSKILPHASRSESLGRLTNRTDPEFHQRLQELLSDIQKLKLGLANSEDQKATGDQNAIAFTSVRTKVEDAETGDAKDSLPTRIDSHKSKSGFVSNDELVQQHDALLEKLSRLEENAGRAIERVVSLRTFVDKFNEETKDQNGGVGKDVQDDWHNFKKLKHLDLANRSLQNLLQDIEPGFSHEDSHPNTTQLDFFKITTQVQDLQNRLKDDRHLIGELQTTLCKIKSTSMTEKEETKKKIKIHKDRADRYLASIESLNLRTTQKNKEISKLRQEVSSLRLHLSQLMSEKDRLDIENNTLASKLNIENSKQRNQDVVSRSELEEVSTKLFEAISKMSATEVDNERLRISLDGCNNEIVQQKAETEKLKVLLQEKLLQNEMPSLITKVSKSTQVAWKSAVSKVDSSDKPDKGTGQESEQWLKMFEMWQQLQNDKINILQTLKDLEHKLETSQQANVAFSSEMTKKEVKLKEIGLRLEEKIEENKSLQRFLESALSDTKNYGDLAKEKFMSLDITVQSRCKDLEKMLLESQRENATLKRDKHEMEQKLSARVTELQQRLELADKSKRAMNDYIQFLKSSYANVFGDGFLVK